jgi:RNA polymerase sigma factor (sigma-70 family)
MVLCVCRRVLGNTQDADDACQATFLVLVSKAATIRAPGTLGNWLYGVANRTALHARHAANKRRAKEAALPTRSEAPEDGWAELLPVLDLELERLPDRYRAVIVLCALQGKTRKEAARDLGCAEGTVASRLSRGLALLAKRLTRHGRSTTAGALAAVLSQSTASATVPSSLLAATVRIATLSATGQAAATGLIPFKVTSLAEGVLRTMLLSRLTRTAVVLFLAVLMVAGIALSAMSPASEQDAKAAPQKDEPAAVDAKDAQPGNPEKLSIDIRELQGTWVMQAVEKKVINGKVQPPRETKITFVVSEDRLIWLGEDGMKEQEFTIKVDATNAPKTIDLTSPQVGVLRGIYRLHGDSLQIYLGDRAGDRPGAFPDKADAFWSLTRLSRTPRPVASRFPNAPGCTWMIEPTGVFASSSTFGIVCVYDRDRDGAALIIIAAALPGSRAPEYRPVLLDGAKKRYLPEVMSGGGSSARNDGAVVALSRWRMDPKVLPAGKVALIGIEMLSPDFHRAAASEARAQAINEGLEVLPYPEIGKPFDFSLTTVDGTKIRAADFRGKVLIIDCWATWCAPCMRLQPELSTLYQKRRHDGLEVIGVNFDSQVETMAQACQRLSLPWPQVMVPLDEKKRRLWEKAGGIQAIPRLLVIDRDGVLRADGPTDLGQQVTKLLSDSRAGQSK